MIEYLIMLGVFGGFFIGASLMNCGGFELSRYNTKSQSIEGVSK